MGRAMQNTMNMAVNIVLAIMLEPKYAVKPGGYIGLNEAVCEMQG